MKRMTKIVVTTLVALSAPLTLLAQANPSPVSGPETDQLEAVRAVRAAYKDGRDQDVLLLADRALLETTRAGDLAMRAPELHFWRGAALRRLGRHEEALIALDQARALGFEGPELHLERGLAHRSLGQGQEADRDYQDAERLLPGDPDTRERFFHRWKWDGKDQPRFQLVVTPQTGFDSNIIGLDEDTPLVQSDIDFDSPFAGVYLDAKYFPIMNDRQLLWLGYQNLVRHYTDEPDVSFTDNIATLGGRQPLLPSLDIEARGSLEEAFLRDDGHFRTQRTVGPAGIWKPLPVLQLRLWADWTDADYYGSVPAEQDRDGEILRGGLRLAFDLGRGWSVAPHVSVNRYDAEGLDYESRGWEVGVSVSPDEFAGLRVVASVSYGDQDYDNPNSLAGFTEKRHDRPISATLGVTLRMLESLIGYAPTLSVSYMRHRSNIDNFDYDRWSPQIEVGIAALSF